MKWLIVAAIALAAIVVVVLLIGVMLPKSHVATRTAKFKAPPQSVWDVITGPPDWRPEVRSFSNLPAREGRPVWKEIDKDGQAITFERVESDPPRRTVTRIDPGLPFGGTWTYQVAPGQEGTVLTITENGEVYNPLFRFVSRFIMGHTASIDAYLKALHAKLGEAA